MSPKFQADRSSQVATKSHGRMAFLLSLSLHVIALTLFLLASPKTHLVKMPAAGPVVVQKSTTVNQSALNREIAAVKAERTARINSERRAVRSLQHRQANLQHSLSEKQRRLRASQQKLSNQQARLAKLRQVQQQTQKQLAGLQQKERVAEKSYQVKQHKLADTQAKLKALKAQQAAVTSAVKKRKLAQQAKILADKLRQQQLAADKAQLQRQQLNAGIINRYRARILAAIQQRWIVPKETKPGMHCKFLVQLSSAGTVEKVQLLQSSGNPVLDRSARVALFKASPLPMPKDPSLNVAFHSIRLNVKPEI